MNEGIVLIDKPAGKTSFYLVKVLRGHLKVKKIGHAGTLDPFATGVMVLLVGQNYTRRSDSFMKYDKEYIARIKLGETTDTYDLDGQTTHTNDVIPTPEALQEALLAFQGTVKQTPPMYSAKKVGGQKLYDLARAGKTIERKPATVTMTTELLGYSYPHVDIRVSCSKGTYVRSIAHDLGEALQCGGHLTSLKRTRVGPYKIEDCVTLEEIRDGNCPLLQ